MLSSEGTRLGYGRTLYSVQMTAYARSKDGVTIEHQRGDDARRVQLQILGRLVLSGREVEVPDLVGQAKLNQ